MADKGDTLADDMASAEGTPISAVAPERAEPAQEKDAARALLKLRIGAGERAGSSVRLRAGVLRTQSSDDEVCDARGGDGRFKTVIEVDFPTRLRRRSPTAQWRTDSPSPTRHPPPYRSSARHSPTRHSPTRHSPTRHSPTRHSPTRPRRDGSPTSTTEGSDHLRAGGARHNRAKMCSALDMEDDPVRPAPAARRNRAKMCSALDMEDDPVHPARGSASGNGARADGHAHAARERAVKPCSNIDQDDDEAPVSLRVIRGPRRTSQSPVRVRASMKPPVRVEVPTSQSRAASPVRSGARSGPSAGAGARAGSPVWVGRRGGTSPRRSPTRSRPVKIAALLTKSEQRAALLRQKREKQQLLETLLRDLEREAPAAAQACLEAGAHDGVRPDLARRDETVHGDSGQSLADRDVTVRSGARVPGDSTVGASRSETMRYRDRIRELEERKEHEEWRKRTQQAQEELLALVRDAQRSGNVVVYYRFSDAKDCEKRLGKVCRMYPPHSRHMHAHSRTHMCVRAHVCQNAHRYMIVPLDTWYAGSSYSSAGQATLYVSIYLSVGNSLSIYLSIYL